MSPKLGQKITDNPKTITVRARMDKDTLEKLDYLVESEGLDRSKVIRKGIEIQYESAIKKIEVAPLPTIATSKRTNTQRWLINLLYLPLV